jgi:hypothetical protein
MFSLLVRARQPAPFSPVSDSQTRGGASQGTEQTFLLISLSEQKFMLENTFIPYDRWEASWRTAAAA